MPHKLLLADDSLTIQKVVNLIFAHEGFEVKAVNDGEQAFQAMEFFAPDIVLADIEMPKLNGYQLCEKIKNNMATAQIPVILLAGAFEPFDEDYAKAVGADDFIVKPFESQELISKVRALLINFERFKETKEVHKEELVSHEEEPFAADKLSENISMSQETMGGDFDKQQEIIDEEHKAITAIPQETKEFVKEFMRGENELSELSDVAHYLSQKSELPSREDISEMIKSSITKEVSRLISSDIIPSREDISEMIKSSITKEVSRLINNDMIPYVHSLIKDSFEKTISENTPDVIKSVTMELTKEMLESLRGEIDGAIKRIIPEVAESIITGEIKKITEEL